MTLRVVRMVEEQFHRDVEGRPIREGRTPPEFLRPSDIEFKQCPYTGSRHLHANPMNVSALRQMSARLQPTKGRFHVIDGDRTPSLARPRLLTIEVPLFQNAIAHQPCSCPTESRRHLPYVVKCRTEENT